MTASVGLILGSHIPPQQIPELARAAEDGGLGEIWVAEDYFFSGGIACAMAALDATSRIPVGLGVVSAMTRHPALLAMEIATVAGLHPGRLAAGIGLGVPDWIRQMGVHPRSPLTAMRESVTSVRRLLAGEEVTLDGDVFRLDAVKLAHLPAEPVPIAMGVIGPRMLRLAGEIADGTVASATATPQYVRWMRERIAEGGATEHRVTTFALYSVGPESAAAKEQIRHTAAFYLALPPGPLTDAYGISDELADMQQRGGADAAALIAREMPDRWLDDMVVAGDPEECAEKIGRLLEAGSDSVALFPVPAEHTREMLATTARDVLPRLTGEPHGR